MNEHIKKLTHVTIKSKQYYEAVEFYEKTLELERKFTLYYTDSLVKRMEQVGFVKAGDPWITYFKIFDREFIELFNQNYLDEDPVGDYSFVCMTLAVEDLKEAAKALREKNVVLYKDMLGQQELMEEADGLTEFYIKDLDGNMIRYR